MIDMMGNTTYTKEELKARAMSRTAMAGLGLAERLANIERIAYHLLDPKKHPLADPAQVAAIGDMLALQEADYDKEVADNDALKLALEHEAARDRLALPPLNPNDYPDVIDPDTGSPVRNPALVEDDAERAAAQSVIDSASAGTIQLVTDRDAHRASSLQSA